MMEVEIKPEFSLLPPLKLLNIGYRFAVVFHGVVCGRELKFMLAIINVPHGACFLYPQDENLAKDFLYTQLARERKRLEIPD